MLMLFRKIVPIGVSLILFVLLSPLVHGQSVNIIRVDTTSTASTPDGSTWALAYPTLQDALAAASAGDEIWIADGIYYTDEIAPGDANSTFELPDNVSIYGGFSGLAPGSEETLRSQRAPSTNIVTLSGDIDQDDGASIVGTNSGPVVTVLSSVTGGALLDGVTVTGGDGTFGGGIFTSGVLTIQNVTVTGNQASDFGGGIEVDSGTLVAINSFVTNNNATSGGGGIDNFGSGTITLTNTQITGNSAQLGAGINHEGTSITIEDSSLIDGNIATQRAGGINTAGSTLTIIGSTISNNSTTDAVLASFRGGGAIFNDGSTITIRNSIISGNTSPQPPGGGGGGIYNLGASGNIEVINSTISGNMTTAGDGAGVFNNAATLTISNSTISGNMAFNLGAGVHTFDGSVTINNSTISGNMNTNPNPSSTATGGGIFVFGGADLTLNNSTITGNSAPAGAGGILLLNGTLTTSNSLIAGNSAPGKPQNDDCESDVNQTFTSNGGNLFGTNGSGGGCAPNAGTPTVPDLTPNTPIGNILNTTLANYGGDVETHELVTGSPAIDAGDNNLIPSDTGDLDNDGNTTEAVPFDGRGAFDRVDGIGVDIGAYEFQPGGPSPICTLSTPTGVTEASVTPFNIEVDCTASTPNGVYGLDAGLSIPSPSDLLIAENTATTPTWSSTAADSFETLAGSVIGGQPPVNNLGLYAISRSGAASGLTTAFEVGRVDFLAAAAITQNRLESDPEPEATVDCTLTLSDVNGSPINASCVNTTFEVEDTLFATLQGAFSVNSDGTVSDMRASLAVTGDDSSTFGGPFSASGSSIATFNSGILNITGITDAQSPVDAELNIDGHIDCLALDGFNLRDLPTVNDLTGSTTRDAGDANDDRLIGTLDRDTIAGQFGLNEGDTGFTQDADVNGDNTINVLDLVHVGRNFGTGTGSLPTCAGLSGDNTTD